MSNKKANILISIIVVVIIIICFFTYKWDRKTTDDFLKTEINNKDYYSLIIKYDYVKGSKQGIDYKNDLKTALKDGIYFANKYGTKSYEIQLLEDTEVKNGIFIKPIKLFGRFNWFTCHAISN